MPEVSVILCVRNGAATLGRQLAALSQQSFRDFELLVVDNGSTDDSSFIARSFAPMVPELRIVEAFDKPGLSYARNAGAAVARGDVLAFCDADDVVDPNWLAALVMCCRRADQVCGRLRLERLNSALSRYWRGMTEDEASFPVALGYLPYAVGANFAIRRSVYEQVGGCDERFTVCSDDVDLSWRVQHAGFVLAPCTGAVVDYQLREQLGETLRQRYRYGRTEALIVKKFAGQLPRMTFRDRWPMWRFLLTRWFHLFLGRRRRGGWLGWAAYAAGRIAGGWRYHVVHY